MVNISIVCSFFNEEDVLQRFIDNITLVCSKISSNYEVIFIDDCSKDNSAEIIKKNIKFNNKIKYLKTTRNFGNASCIVAGLKKSKGDCVVIIDCDLEDPPELILEMYEKYKEGFEIVHTRRERRDDIGIIKNYFTKKAYQLINLLSEIDLPNNIGIFKLISRRALNEIIKIKEYDPYLRGLFNWVGFKQTYINYKRNKRTQGESNFKIFASTNPWKEIIRGITSFSMVPLYMALLIGFIFVLFAIIFVIYAVIQKMILSDITSGWTAIVSLIAILGGVNIFIIGVIGIYISKIYENVRGRPQYIIEEDQDSTSEIHDR